ncbi:MAG: thermonuclease family protein [Burkholderiales bacterium]|nr:MAG: thermonuclease family protein [Burkholderiales bacterium]
MKFLLVGLVVCFIQLQAQAKIFQGIVTHVSDGDTLWIEVDPKTKPIKVRLQGIDAPEICQAWGTQARDALKARLLRQSVSLNTRAKDDYERALGRVAFRGEDVGSWLVKNGYAWSYHYRRDPGPYVSEEAAARKARLGLWAQAGAQEPREFRKKNGPCKH